MSFKPLSSGFASSQTNRHYVFRDFLQYTGKTKQLRTQTTSYLYRGEQLLKEYTGEGSPLAEYYYANGRVIARNMFGFHDRKTWGHQDTVRIRGGLMYYHYDALGNVTDFTDRLGQNVVKYRWDAYGGMFAGVLAPYSKMGITGKEYDPKPGLVFFGSRWYSPMVGQFIMPDSFMGELNKPQSLNSYAYAWNNPVNRIDPTGHWVDVVTHGSWRLANCRQRRRFLLNKNAGILAAKVEKPSLVNLNKEMASSSFAA